MVTSRLVRSSMDMSWSQLHSTESRASGEGGGGEGKGGRLVLGREGGVEEAAEVAAAAAVATAEVKAGVAAKVAAGELSGMEARRLSKKSVVRKEGVSGWVQLFMW